MPLLPPGERESERERGEGSRKKERERERGMKGERESDLVPPQGERRRSQNRARVTHTLFQKVASLTATKGSMAFLQNNFGCPPTVGV